MTGLEAVLDTETLLATTLDGFVLADDTGRILHVNPAYCKLVGFAREELLAMNIRDLEGTLRPAEIEQRIEQMKVAGRARFETRHRRKDGELVDLDVSISVVGDGRWVAAFVRDLSAQHLAARELHNNNLLLTKAQQLAHLGIWRWDVTTNRVTWSPELYRIYGLDPDSFGASFEAYLERVHPGDRDRVRATVGGALQSREPFEFSERILRPDGGQRYLRSWGSVVLDAEGNPQQLFGACLDVTEEQLAHDELEARVATRTAELAQAKNRAESADRIKSAFLATMSHELRTPLNSILGFTGILLQGLVGELNAEQRKQLGMVKNSAQHLLQLINDVLDISKIEAGELELARGRFDARAVIDAAVAMIRPLADKKGLAVTVDVDPALGDMVGDERRLGQVLLNLLSNAVKFTGDGEVRLTARVDGDRARFVVADTGIGIAEEDLVAVFEPFHQIDSGLARRHDGTGLGLAISRRLARMMNGDITVHSSVGVGTTFEVCLPVA